MKKSFLLLAVVAGMTISASALSNGTKTGTFEREQVDTVKTKTDSTVEDTVKKVAMVIKSDTTVNKSDTT